MIKLIKRYLYNNKKRDIYQIRIKAFKNDKVLFNFYDRIAIDSKVFPTRRLIAKFYGNQISNHIKKYRSFKGCKIEVIIITKIGTFKRKQLVEF